MAALSTLPQYDIIRKSPIARSGVLTLTGFGIKVRMQSGHLEIEDGIGQERRKIRLARVGHRLRRLVMIGSDGFVTFEALRWLADQDAAFVMLNRDGSVLATTGPVRPSDARLRRAQALANHSGASLRIAKELISRKLAGQGEVAHYKLQDSQAAQEIAQCRSAVAIAESISAVRSIEARGASAYWWAWRNVPIMFPKNDLPRVPNHWCTFNSRTSPLTGSPRVAANPANAMLNYLYTLLASEARLAGAALGLDPGLGFLHLDAPARDSLAFDLMEPIRPKIDAYVLDWIRQQPLRREWFFEQRDGNCRLMAPFAIRLTETTPMWERAVAPIAEWVTSQLWQKRKTQSQVTPTRLTQARKRQAQGGVPEQSALAAPRRETLCRNCGKPLARGQFHCAECAVGTATENLLAASALGRAAAHTPEARAKEGQKQRQHAEARGTWKPSNQPAWLTAKVFSSEIKPLLTKFSNSVIASRIGVSRWYAGRIRKGDSPHPRHWQGLAEMVGISPNG
jgi:CRISPR-associated endonuclease Cas1